ncbi:MAG: OB-fold domain-containing protein [Mycobacterium sp.]|nr:OB-fold domain-containing protein [Mycobacterium sp.]
MTTVALEDWLLDGTLAPTVDGDPLAPLYSAAARGELALPFCAGCAQPVELDQEICDTCGSSEQDWHTVELRGTVHSATLMHRREPGLVRTQNPYPIVDVELTSGHRLVLTTMHPTDTPPAIGTTLTIGFRHLGNVAIPAIDTLEDQ